MTGKAKQQDEEKNKEKQKERMRTFEKGGGVRQKGGEYEQEGTTWHLRRSVFKLNQF